MQPLHCPGLCCGAGPPLLCLLFPDPAPALEARPRLCDSTQLASGTSFFLYFLLPPSRHPSFLPLLRLLPVSLRAAFIRLRLRPAHVLTALVELSRRLVLLPFSLIIATSPHPHFRSSPAFSGATIASPSTTTCSTLAFDSLRIDTILRISFALHSRLAPAFLSRFTRFIAAQSARSPDASWSGTHINSVLHTAPEQRLGHFSWAFLFCFLRLAQGSILHQGLRLDACTLSVHTA
ncbi:hypothetical protein BCV70DRAFT_56672 [Testicularia cyperi]|uniref:Uncharacterized protein n=1 Tax=Testicularia cyperi TaxID=1882483 RepID=A0A317XUX1_9BASI|nr:hypothetical protein BCV70DRAFT_56672 [Testicularia cyperi]